MVDISVIVPVYNVKNYLKKCLDSIINQTFKNIEIILVDDGSDDGSEIICDEYAKLDKRIITIHKKNEGAYVARNEGLKIASGRYISFIDSDDFVHEKMLEILYNNAQKFNGDLVICGITYLNENSNRPIGQNFIRVPYKISKDYALHNMVLKDNITYDILWNKLFRRDLMGEDFKFNNYRVAEDSFVMPKLLYKSTCIVCVPYRLYYYVKRNGSLVNSKFSFEEFRRLEVIEERISFFKQIKRKKLEVATIERYILMLFIYYNKTINNLYGSEREKCEEYIFSAIRRNLEMIMENSKLISKKSLDLIDKLISFEKDNKSL